MSSQELWRKEIWLEHRVMSTLKRFFLAFGYQEPDVRMKSHQFFEEKFYSFNKVRPRQSTKTFVLPVVEKVDLKTYMSSLTAFLIFGLQEPELGKNVKTQYNLSAKLAAESFQKRNSAINI